MGRRMAQRDVSDIGRIGFIGHERELLHGFCLRETILQKMTTVHRQEESYALTDRCCKAHFSVRLEERTTPQQLLRHRCMMAVRRFRLADKQRRLHAVTEDEQIGDGRRHV